MQRFDLLHQKEHELDDRESQAIVPELIDILEFVVFDRGNDPANDEPPFCRSLVSSVQQFLRAVQGVDVSIELEFGNGE